MVDVFPLGEYLKLPFTLLGHGRQDLQSVSDGRNADTDWANTFSSQSLELLMNKTRKFLGGPGTIAPPPPPPPPTKNFQSRD